MGEERKIKEKGTMIEIVSYFSLHARVM